MAAQPTLFSFFKSSPKVPIDPNTNVKIKGKVFKHLDLVWAKLDGFPWWPSLICKHPQTGKIIRNKLIHVQFFDDPPTRGWVKPNFIKPYGPPLERDIPVLEDLDWIAAKEKGDTVPYSLDEREKLIVVAEESEESSDSDAELNDSDQENKAMNNLKKRSPTTNGDGGPSKKKRKLVILSDSDVSGDEYAPASEEEQPSDDSDISSGVDENEVSEPEVESSEMETPIKEDKKEKKKIPRSSLSNTPKAGVVKKNISFSTSSSTPKSEHNASAHLEDTKSKLSLFARQTPSKPNENTEAVSWPFLSYPFLQPDNIKDLNGKRPTDPDYDRRTLYVPNDFLNSQTPGQRQWWVLKSKHFDIILFFKMGKFYELFSMDAVIGVQELGLSMMKGDKAHVGFPEIAYGRFSASLIEKGYKVARIEQTENPQMMEERCKKLGRATRFDKVVNRELCQVASRGVRLPSVLEGEVSEEGHAYLLSVTERTIDSLGDGRSFGVSFIDTSIGTFFIGQFEDDRHLSRLRTLVAHYPPVQIMYERNKVSSKVLSFLKALVPSDLLDGLSPEKEFWSAEKVLKFMAELGVGKAKDDSKAQKWPLTIKGLVEEGSFFSPKMECELGLNSLGGLLWTLDQYQVVEDLLSRQSFEIYKPIASCGEKEIDRHQIIQGKNMVLDGTTLTNLEVFKNSSGGTEGTLYQRLNNCCTPFGKRLLHIWLCSPLLSPASINARLDAIQDLRENAEVLSSIRPLLKTLPDLDKLLSKIHSQGLRRLGKDRPDSRAIFYEEIQYNQRKVSDFLATLKAFKTAIDIIELFNSCRDSLKSSLLKDCVTICEDENNPKNGRIGKFPKLDERLKFFDTAFNHAEAKTSGLLIPSSGVDEEFDLAESAIEEVKKKLDSYLKEQCRFFDAKVTYIGNDKRRYQLEVPDHGCRRAGNAYELVGQRKGYKRFITKETKLGLIELTDAEERREEARRGLSRRIFEQFDNHYPAWSSAIHCLSVLDVLQSLTEFSMQIDSCRPDVVSLGSNQKPFISIKEGKHPCSINLFSGGDYIPNDLVIQEGGEPLVMVTGPNMGGKSTLMRQTGLICLLAQLGCYVPALECSLSIIDRIFTRLGAYDRIHLGESTFYVELAETASIIYHATLHSLVLVDELGRGTATHDGTAVASGVVDSLTKTQCRTLFSTHFHALVEQFLHHPKVAMGHMACLVHENSVSNDAELMETDSDVNESPSSNKFEAITFLYKFTSGPCPKSYGFNAARLASIPLKVVENAVANANILEARDNKRRLFSRLFAANTSVDDLKKILGEARLDKMSISRSVN